MKAISLYELAHNADVKVFTHLIYEFEKGVRNMVLYTLPEEYVPFLTQKLENREIRYFLQPVPERPSTNIFFGKEECLDAVRTFLGNRPLNELSPEEDFMLGAILGYDLCKQCKRYCDRIENTSPKKNKQSKSIVFIPDNLG